MRRIILIGIISLFGNAIAQPDTVWTYTSPTWYGSGRVLGASESGVVITRWTITSFPEVPWWFVNETAQKISPSGEEQWTLDTGWPLTHCGTQDAFINPDGRHYLIGWRSSQCMGLSPQNPSVICVSPDGEVIWNREYNFENRLPPVSDYYPSHAVNESGCYLLCNERISEISKLLKINLDGDSLWTVNVTPRTHCSLFGIVAMENGNFMVIGSGSNNGGPTESFIAQIDSMGSIIQQHTINAARPIRLLMHEDIFYVVGADNSAAPYFAWFAKFDQDCNLIDYREESSTSRIYSMSANVCRNGDLIAYYKPYSLGHRFVRLTQDFEVQWATNDYFTSVHDMQELDDGSFYLMIGLGEAVLARTEPDIIESAPSPIEIPSDILLHPAYPNPFNPNTTITFELAHEMNVTLAAYDILGNQVATLVNGSMSAGTHEVTFNATNLPSGIYFCRLQAGDFSQTQKLMLLK